VNDGLLVVPVEPLDFDLEEVLRLPDVLDVVPLPDVFVELLTLPDGDVSPSLDLDFLPLPLTLLTLVFFGLLTLPGPLPLPGVLSAGVGLGLTSVSLLLDLVFLPLPLTGVFVELLTLIFFGLLTLPGPLPLPGALPSGVGLGLTSVSLLLDLVPLPLPLTEVFFGLLTLGPLSKPGVVFELLTPLSGVVFELLKLPAGVGLVLELDFLPLPLTPPVPLLTLGSEFIPLPLTLAMLADPLLWTLVPELFLLDTALDESSSSSSLLGASSLVCAEVELVTDGSLRSVAEFVVSRRRMVGSCTTLKLVLAKTIGQLAAVETTPKMKDE
jgi:hypothetical protein